MLGMPSEEMLECLRLCGECAGTCAQCSAHCLHLGGDHAAREHQTLMRDCAEACALAGSFVARSSEFAGLVCHACAEVCVACAESCERMSTGDAMMARCAKTCRECAEVCSRIGAEVHH